MQIKTYSGHKAIGPIDIKNYWNDRKNLDLYRLSLMMAATFFMDAKSAIDIGCYTSSLLVEMDWIRHRVANDINSNLKYNWEQVKDVKFLAGDALEIQFSEIFDFVICNQTIEHLDNPKEFIEKLLRLGRGLIISTTYQTPHGLIKGHIQDPISLEKFQSWFPVPLDSYTICYHPTNRLISHIIGVIKNNHPYSLNKKDNRHV